MVAVLKMVLLLVSLIEMSQFLTRQEYCVNVCQDSAVCVVTVLGLDDQ
jgi:hypothetical protein